MREWGYFLFFTSFFCLYFGGSIYTAWRVNIGLKLRAPYTYYIYALAGIMASLATLAYVFANYNINFCSVFLSTAGGIWMGIIGITAAILFANDILNFANLIFKIKDFRYYSTFVSLIVAAVLCVWSLANVAFVLNVKEIKLKVPDLKTDKLSVLLLADMHIDKHTSAKVIQKIVKISNDLNPDIVVVAGDLIDTDISQTYAKYDLDKLQSKHGIFAVTGNHEYYTGIKSYEKLCETLNFRLLRNENFTVSSGSVNLVTVAGINDKQGTKQKTDIVDVESAFRGVDKDLPVIFLSHRPQYFDLVKDKEVQVIQLSGHTHAGQLLPAEMMLRVFFKYFWGLYEHNGSYMYLTSGNRWWRAPMRTFNTCEIVKITLQKE